MLGKVGPPVEGEVPVSAVESRWRVWFSAIRVRTLPAAVAPVLVGSALAWHDGLFQALPAALCLGFGLLIQVGTNFANDYFDFRQGADGPGRVGPRRVVAAGLVAPEVMRRAMAGVFAAAFLLGLGLLPWGGPPLLVIGVTSVVCGVAYTGGPWPLGYHGLGDLFVFVFFGLVAVVTTHAVQAGGVSVTAFAVAVPVGLLAANILVVNNYRDVEGDARVGKRTLVVRFGRDFARAQFGFSLATALLVPAALAARWHRPVLLLPLLVAPRAWGHFRRLHPSATAPELIALLGDTGKLLAAYAVLISVGLVLAR
jgi:1,4-dihydroxy-2-naphthoate octaprenyltransferase